MGDKESLQMRIVSSIIFCFCRCPVTLAKGSYQWGQPRLVCLVHMNMWRQLFCQMVNSLVINSPVREKMIPVFQICPTVYLECPL